MLANRIIYQQLHGLTEWNLIQCYSQRNLVPFFNAKMGMKMSTVLTDKGELLLSNKVNGTSLIPERFGMDLVFRVTWKGHCVWTPFPLIHSLFSGSGAAATDCLLQHKPKWHLIHTLAAIQAYLVEQASVNWGLQVFSTAFISSFHAVEMLLAVLLTVIPHPSVPLLFANTALRTSRCVISKDFSLGRLCKWSVKLGALR